MINFYNITDRDNQEYYEAVEVYKAGTPDELQIKPELLDEKMDSGYAIIILGKQNAMPVFMAMLWKLEGTAFMVNEVVSIIPSFKHIDFGKMYFDVLKHSAYYEDHHIIFEAQDPDFGHQQENMEKLDYYFKHGCQWVKNVKTVVPMPTDSTFENTILMLLTKNRFLQLTKKQLSEMLIKLFKDLYQTEEDAYLLQEILKHIPEHIELSGRYE